MTEFDLLVRGGEVVTENDVGRADIGIEDGQIAAIAPSLGAGAEELDASGKLVLPGGVDAHCHIAQLSSSGVQTADGFRSATRSAACGGTTTVIPFAPQQKGESLAEAVAAYARRAVGEAIVDYGFNLIVSDPTPQVLDRELPALVAEGHTAVKIFLTYDAVRLEDRQVLDVLAKARELDALVMVHAENHELMGWITRRLLAEGCTAPRYHAVAHAPEAEREAVHRIIAFAEVVGARLLILHLSGRHAIEEVRRARARGVAVFGETCPQYLVLTDADMDRPGFEGAKFMCSPPPRDAANQAEVWRGMAEGVIQAFDSDHAGYRFDDPEGKKVRGEDAPFTVVPNGVPGLETRLPILFSEGVRKGRIDLRRFAELGATNAARLFGLYPRKGVLAEGSDADLAIWDPERRVTVTVDELHDNMDYTPYEGMEIEGWPVTTLSRGTLVWHDGRALGDPGRGQLLRRTSPRTEGLAP